MARYSTKLNFATEGQSLWGPGDSIPLQIDTGDDLIFHTSGAKQLPPLNLLGNGFTAEAYLDMTIGLFAFASLGETGSFDASLSMSVDVEMPGGIQIATFGAQQTDIPQTFEVSFPNYSLAGATLETNGFDASAKAGLHFVLGIEAGLRNGEYFHWFGSGEFADLKLIDIDFSEPLENSIPLVEISTASPELELELTDGISISARLPTGADTKAEVFFEGRDKPTITAEGASDTRFISLDVDLDELLVRFASKIPGVGAVIKGIGETVFAEHEFDLNDYLPIIPRGKLVASATMLDIGASTGLVVTEKNTVDFSGGDGTDPNLLITLRSDQGTPDNMLDDIVETTRLGADPVSFARPVFNAPVPTDQAGMQQVGDIGDIRVHALYSLGDVRFDHEIGLGLNSVFTVEALKGELGGSWVPSFLQINLGPVLGIEIPEGGFNLDLFSEELPGFNLQEGAFNSVSDVYEIFYTTELAPGQDSEADLDDENAREAVIQYREDRQVNIAETATALGDLIDATFTRHAISTGTNNFIPGINQSRFLAVWDGEQEAVLEAIRINPSNKFAINPLNPDSGRLVVNADAVLDGAGVLRDETNNVTDLRFDTGGAGFETLLQEMDGDFTRFLQYTWDKFSGADRTLQTEAALDIIGGDFGDVLVWFYNQGQRTANLIDGGDNRNGEYDVFVGNFAERYGDVAIEWDLAEEFRRDENGNVNRKGVTIDLGFDEDALTVRNVEALKIMTGDADDFISGYAFSDLIITNGGSDHVVLVADVADDTVDLGADDDFLRAGIGAGGGRDQVSGGLGFDLMTLESVGGDGLRLDIVADGVRAVGGQGLDHASGTQDLVGLMDAYWSDIFFGGTMPRENRTGLANNESEDHVRYSQLFNGGSESVIEINGSLEQISVVGQDEADDLVLFTGGHLYEGGTGIYDTFVGDLGSLGNASGGIDIGGPGDLGELGRLPRSIGDTTIRGFERWIIRTTSQDDRIDGGPYADFIDASFGNDIVFGGGGEVIDVIFASHGSDIVWWFNSGADILDGGISEDADGQDVDRDTLVVRPSFGTGSEARGGLNYAFLDGIGEWDGSGRADRVGFGIVDADDGVSNILFAMFQAALTRSVTAISYGKTTLEEMAVYTDFEKVDIVGSDAHDDLIIYSDGLTYVGGERAFDGDTFAANFSGQVQGIDLRITEDDTEGRILANGIFVQGMDRLVIVGGEVADILHGGRLDDYLNGGAGSDRLFGGWGDDILLGAAGDDVIYWSSDGFDLANGGDGRDRLIVSGLDPDENARALGIRLNEGEFNEFDYVGGDLEMLGIDALLFSLVAPTSAAIRAETLETEPPSTFIGLEYSNFELIDVLGAEGVGDLIVYDGGTLYWGGNGDATDLFVANLAGETADLYFDVGHMSAAIPFEDDVIDTDEDGFAGTFDIGNGTAIGGFERLGLQLGSGADRAVGGALDDHLAGGDGEDTLVSGGSGAEGDVLLGQDGDDLLVHSGGVALLDGGDGFADRAQLDNMGQAVTLGIRDAFGPIRSYDALDLVTFADMAQLRDDLDVFPASHLTFSDATGAAATLTGIERLDARGSALGDVLMATTGPSQLYGEDGADVLLSGAGRDLLLGGAGLDRYVFMNDFGLDIVGGETVGGGALYFTDLTRGDLTFGDNGGDLEIVTPDGTVRINDWFTLGGLDFTIHTTDDAAGFTVPGDAPGGTGFVTSTVDGTEDSDTDLAGTAGVDSMRGLAGDDELLGSGGRDVFDGGSGFDVVSYAHLDAEVYVNLDIYQGLGGVSDGDIFGGVEGIIAGQRAAALIGDVEDNFFAGSPVGDFLFGFEGDDMIVSLEGDDDVYGGGGADVLFGDEGVDTLRGEGGDDYIDGGDGDDEITGGDGADTLRGGDGDDRMRGEGGEDILMYGGEDRPNTEIVEGGRDTLDGGAERDMVDLSLFEARAIIDLGAGRIDTNDTQTADPAGPLRQIAELVSIEEARGTAVDDVIRGNDADNHIEGGSGDDTLSGGFSGNNTLFGGDGVDIVDYRDLAFSAYVTFDPALGPVVMSGGSFSDQLESIEGVLGSDFGDGVEFWDDDNFAALGLGNDAVNGGGGNDVLGGGAGDDSVVGGEGLDIYDVSDGAQAVAIDMEFGLWQDGHSGEDTVLGMEGARGTAFDDTIAGDAGINVVHGGAGDDSLEGHGGADLLDGGDGDDTLIAGAPQLVLVKPESFENNLDEEAPNLNDYLTLGPRRSVGPDAPTATVHGTTSGAKEVYKITVEAGDTLIVDMDRTSGDFDPFLILFNVSAVIIAQNDDGVGDPGSETGNGRFDSQLEHTFAFGGTYTIQLNAYFFDPEAGEVRPRAPDAGDDYVMHVSLEGGEAVDPGEAGAVLMGVRAPTVWWAISARTSLPAAPAATRCRAARTTTCSTAAAARTRSMAARATTCWAAAAATTRSTAGAEATRSAAGPATTSSRTWPTKAPWRAISSPAATATTPCSAMAATTA